MCCIRLGSSDGDVGQILLEKQTIAILATILHGGREPVTTEVRNLCFT